MSKIEQLTDDSQLKRNSFDVVVCGDKSVNGAAHIIPISIDVDDNGVNGRDKISFICFIWAFVSRSTFWPQKWFTSTTVEIFIVKYWHSWIKSVLSKFTSIVLFENDPLVSEVKRAFDSTPSLVKNAVVLVESLWRRFVRDFRDIFAFFDGLLIWNKTNVRLKVLFT